ncbi:MAG: hypothetical protein JWN70_5148 [Planctomycetaceae bacterium]|nr:hypothetical protein [Planctomycetaceae bacterium]
MDSPSEFQLDRRQWLAVAATSLLIRPLDLAAEDSALATGQFTFEDRQKKIREMTAKVLVEAQDGGLLLQGTDGRIWQVTPDKLQQKGPATSPFAPLSAAELGKQVTHEFGPGFVSYSTERYALCTNASEPYAHWCLGLFERLATAFRTYWAKQGFKTVDPIFPLVAVVFQKQAQFAEFATVDAGADVAAVPGYFSIPTNRIVLRDLTQTGNGQSARTAGEIEQRLESALYNVATMVHEATHQIAFNCGLHTRMADNPLWLTEGMATYFETPDIRSKTGWKTAGQINRARLRRFKEFLTARRATDSIETLIRNDARLTSPDTAEDAYAESWALTYFLVRKQVANYVKYLTHISAKAPLDFPTPDQRVAEFQDVFSDLKKLDTEFVKYLKTLR